MITTYVSYNHFVKVLKRCIDEMLLTVNSTTLQFYLGSDDVPYKYKSGN